MLAPARFPAIALDEVHFREPFRSLVSNGRVMLNQHQFDTITRDFRTSNSRRSPVMLAAAIFSTAAAPAEAKTKGKKKKPCKYGRKRRGRKYVNLKTSATNGGARIPCKLGKCTAPPAKEYKVCASGCPFTTVQAAIDGIPDGGTIRLAAGTYAGAFNAAPAFKSYRRTMTIDGRAGSRAHTVLRPKTTGAVFLIDQDNFDTNVMIFRNLTFTGGNRANDGAGIIIDRGTVRLENRAVTDNTGSFSGGINVNGSQSRPTVVGGEITNNHAKTGGGVYNGGRITFDGGLVISGASASGGGGPTGGGIANGDHVTRRDGSIGGNSPHDRVDYIAGTSCAA